MTELIDIIINAVDDAAATFESIVNSAEEAAASLTGMGDASGEIDSSQIEETKTQTEETGTQADETTTAFENMNNVLQGLVGVEAFSSIADGLMAAADAAGNYEDSMMRAGLEAEGAGISADAMADTVSHLSDVTGRAGGQIRESFITATARGITDMGSFEKMMEGAGAQATLFGTDIESMGNKFSNMAMRSRLMEKGLASTGITVEELGNAMGIQGATIDEINAKWETMDANQRAAILGTAASMNEGEDANAAYKESWAGLQEQIEIGKGRLERLAGEVLLPVLIPAFEAAARVMDWLGDTISAVMDGPLGGFISIIGAVGAGIALAVPAIIAISSAITLLKGALVAAIPIEWAAITPWLPFIAIGAAVVAIIYEIGKAFNWWDNAGEMIDAVWDGITRLWDAFINHPDVQATIQALTDAWNWLVPAVTGVVQAIMDFFGINESGSFDYVRSLIDNIGQAWNFLTFPIKAIIGLVQTVIGVFNQFSSGQLTLPDLLMTIWSSIGSFFSSILLSIVGFVVKFAGQLVQKAISAARGFVNGIINGIKALPGKVYRGLVAVVSRIGQAITLWKNKAYAMVREVINKITSPFQGVVSSISSALSGVADALTKPFRQAWDWIKPYYDKIKGALDIIPSFGGEAYGGETATATNGKSFSIRTGEYVVSDSQPLVIEDNINLSVDLSNVPGHINTGQLIEALTDKNVLNAFVNNRDFQSLDASVKQKISLKNQRRG